MHPLLGMVRDSDMRVTTRVYRWRPSPWICVATVGATRLGDGWIWLAVAALLFASGSRFHRVLIAATFAGFLASATFAVLKRRFRRPRPCDLLPHPVFRVRAPDRFSFPSGHTINAFAICGVLALEWPGLAPALGLLAGGIGASRVILGLHYVSDVAAGALLGMAIAAGVGALLLP
jgi:undecaprenyl-diphosphatase